MQPPLEMSSEHPSSDDLDVDVFGPLVSLPLDSLVLLATNIRKKVFGISTSAGKVVLKIGGSYNIVHIVQLDDFKLVIRVPATGWGDGMTQMAARALESQVATLRLIASKTTIPVPKIYAFDTTSNNEINAPYVCMSFVSGETASKAWFDKSSLVPLETRRLRTLTSLSQALAQLSQFSFDKIGSVHETSDGSITIGPCYDWHENSDGTIRVVASGPFNSTADYLLEHSPKEDLTSEWGTAATKLLDVLISHFPAQDSTEGFVMSLPDFDSQNVMVDENGYVTGIIDWDLVQTVPRCVGYCRYPGWITRDWDPLMYGWPKMTESENSPEELERYREHYNEVLGAALQRQGDWTHTEKSHVREAVWIAALNICNRLEICRKFVQAAIGGDEDAARGIMYDIGTDCLEEEDWYDIRRKLKQLVD